MHFFSFRCIPKIQHGQVSERLRRKTFMPVVLRLLKNKHVESNSEIDENVHCVLKDS